MDTTSAKIREVNEELIKEIGELIELAAVDTTRTMGERFLNTLANAPDSFMESTSFTRDLLAMINTLDAMIKYQAERETKDMPEKMN
jgi:hypothetical protein